MVQIVELSIAFVVFGILFYFFRPTITCKHKKEIGVARATAIYLDEKGASLLKDEETGLQGKPDMIFETWVLRRYVPLEIKSGKLKEDEPHLGDLYQLVAYFILVEKVYGKRPPYGKLVYANKTFKVRNTAQLRKEVYEVMKQMQQMLEGKKKMKCKADYIKCKHCICKDTVCEWTKEI